MSEAKSILVVNNSAEVAHLGNDIAMRARAAGLQPTLSTTDELMAMDPKQVQGYDAIVVTQPAFPQKAIVMDLEDAASNDARDKIIDQAAATLKAIRIKAGRTPIIMSYDAAGYDTGLTALSQKLNAQDIGMETGGAERTVDTVTERLSAVRQR